MKTQTNSTFANLRKFILVTALVICPLLVVSSSFAQAPNQTRAATVTLTSGGNNFVNIAQGGSFTLTLQMNTNFISLGYTVFLSTTGGGANQFTITGRTNNNTFFTDPTTSDAQALGSPNGVLGSVQPGGLFSNFRDLGYTGDTINNQPAGMGIGLATYTIMANAAIPFGSYTIRIDPRSIVTSDLFKDIPMGGNPIFTVNVVPEPTTVGLAILGGAALLVVARRKIRG